jgi:hypothetical protein
MTYVLSRTLHVDNAELVVSALIFVIWISALLLPQAGADENAGILFRRPGAPHHIWTIQLSALHGRIRRSTAFLAWTKPRQGRHRVPLPGRQAYSRALLFGLATGFDRFQEVHTTASSRSVHNSKRSTILLGGL